MKAVKAATCEKKKKRRRDGARRSRLYKTQKEASPCARGGLDFLVCPPTFPRPFLLRLVSVEASRLSRNKRVKVVTLQEIKAAVVSTRRRILTNAAA
ncbi:uncharacterized protein LOC133564994 isoform X2 [Nerophis ophidion]|uniref:uncharacterized protein LOC133564994 isoform X2 n=1 Tax=Nerophis ophidion TaxID=159077 RepID=UPI002ADFBE63|nr:uncharacterized protein LOC133564994 isoform X2 [Nerophis ophidion]